MAGGSRQIFISYARRDAERVGVLVEGLRQLRYDAWVDEELTGGQAWWDTVLAQIRASSAVLVALSPAALESIAVRREYEYAHAVRRPLLPVVIDRVRLETLPSLLAPLQMVDYRQQDTKSAFALAAAVMALPTPQALPQPLPESPPIPISYLSGLKERSQAATLSMDEQLALVARLKAALGRASDREVAEEVLRSLQNRDDLYLVSAREIESLLSSLNRQVSAPQRQEPPKQARDQTVGKAQESAPSTVRTEAEHKADEADEREAREQTATRAPAQPARGTAPVDSSEAMDLLGVADNPPVRAWRAQIRMEKEGRGWNTFVVISLTHEAHTLVARWTAWRDYVKIDRQTIKESRWSVDGTHVFRMSDGSRILAAQITLKEKESRYTVSRLVVDEKEIPLTYSGA